MRLLMRHQQKGRKFIRRLNCRALLAAAPGTGKTLVAIRTVSLPVLVICRRDDFFTWQNELAQEKEKDIFLIESGSQELPMELAHSWFFVTYDLVRNPRIAAWIRSMPFQWVVADECHLIKGPRSQRTRACITSTRHIRRRLGMTGTLIGNDPIDVFSQCLFIDNGQTFGKDEWAFRNRHYLQAEKCPGWFLRRGAKTLIKQRLARIAYGVHEDDVLDLPPIRKLYKAVPMSKAQTRLYNQVIEEWEYQLASGEVIEIDYVIVQIAKLRQIASGFLYGPPPEKKAEWVHSSKLELYLDLLADENYFARLPKLVTWCAHTAEIERIADEIPAKERVVFYGGISRRQRDQARASFQSNKQIRHFIAQADSGLGMNELICADTAVYFSNSRRVISLLQSMRRIRRKGSEIHKVITYYDLLTEKSIDTHIARDLTGKMDIASYILSQLKRGKPLRSLIQ